MKRTLARRKLKAAKDKEYQDFVKTCEEVYAAISKAIETGTLPKCDLCGRIAGFTKTTKLITLCVKCKSGGETLNP